MFSELIRHLGDNEEWLFSGVGTSLLLFTLKKVKLNKLLHNKKNENIEKETYHIEKIVDVIKAEPTEAKKISERFGLVLELMNENKTYSEYSVASLAIILGLQKVSDLENILLGYSEPTFEFIEQFCMVFGINKDWLLDDKKAPYYNDEQKMHSPMLYLDKIDTVKPQKVFFILEKSKSAPAFIILQLNMHQYKILHRTWHISDDVGHSGRRQLVSFYNLIKELRDVKKYECNGLVLEQSEFKSLFNGDKYPEVYCNTAINDWWDDLTDINHKYFSASDYAELYGLSFVKAQKIIKNNLDV